MRRPKVISVAVAVVRSNGRVLIGQRPAGVELAGLWEFPGGKVQPGERGEHAAARECLEETGLKVRVLGLETEVTHRYDYGTVRLRFYSAAPLDPSQAPVAPFLWVEIGELPRYPFPPANASVLEFLKDEPSPDGPSANRSQAT